MPIVLLTGASGFLGQHLLHELLATGAQVRALSRRVESDRALAALGAIPVRGDVTDPDSLRAAMRGIETVFHAAADTNTWRPNNAAQTRTNVGGAANLLSAAKAEGVSGFVHTSSVSAYSHLVHGTLREDVVERGGESWINYERSKFLAEQAVRGSGLPFLIFQPSHILGPGDTHNWSRLIRLVDLGKLPGVPPGSGAFADVREIARAQVRGWQAGKFGETYLLGGEHASFLELVSRIGQELGRKTPKRATPALALKAYAQAIYGLSLVTRKIPDITPEAAVFTCHDLVVDSGKAMADLGYRQTALGALLADTIAWMRAEKMLS
ncbi:MAG: NAD-dependent epimerase/dehydratase family protein [Arenimonas sp.]|nr:NAD-dependent epimerase/dehydratase family protein [Arenimonas sp.]